MRALIEAELGDDDSGELMAETVLPAAGYDGARRSLREAMARVAKLRL